MDNFATVEQGDMLSQVLPALAASQYLAPAELGRLLLFTSKELTFAAFPSEDDVWASLCFSKWGTPYAPEILRVPFSSPKQCFRQIEEPASIQQQPSTVDLETTGNGAGAVPRELRYSPEDYMMIITLVSEVENRPMFGMAIRGQEIPDFFETGKMNTIFTLSKRPKMICLFLRGM